jgi:two-component system, NarL family, sensor histidine kinase LiaS
MFKSIARRLIVNSVVVALVTTFFGVIVLVIITSTTSAFTLGDKTIAMFGIIPAIFDLAPEERAILNMPTGFSLVVDADERVFYSDNYPACEVGMMLVACAPQYTTFKTNQQIAENGQTLLIVNTTVGYRLISVRQTFSPELYSLSLLIPALCLTLMAIPVAMIIARLTTRRLATRLQHIIHTSKRLANGDFEARVLDSYQDDIGQIGQQLNSMADGLSQNIHLLRDLAQTNTRLMNEVEEHAIQLERVRLSRELHDDIAQKLFSLSAHSATLPALIEQNAPEAMLLSQNIAQLAEQVNLDLRALLMSLRPANMIQRSLSDAIETLCQQFQDAHHIPVDCTLMLQGKHIPSGLQDALYRITQEALNNIHKHARAKTVTVSIVEGKHQLIASITDDGVGFDINNLVNGHLGLMNMRERARAVGGQMTIESDSGHGTTIKVILPIGLEDET